MSSTYGIFEMVCSDIQKQIVIRNLRRIFSEVISKYDVIVQKLIMVLDSGDEDRYEQTINQYGGDSYVPDERIRTVLLKWCITGDCTSPR
jgi:hypothetical protein